MYPESAKIIADTAKIFEAFAFIGYSFPAVHLFVISSPVLQNAVW
jgi:hypothetical protein